jgi:AcrR family transcriptional regulator
MNATGILETSNLSQQHESYTESPSFAGTRNPQNKREALVVAATRLFAARGYRTTTTRNIAAAAGCAEGLIHRYFHGKLGLLQAVLESHTLHDSADLDAEVPPAAALEDEVLQLLDWLVSRIWRDSDIFRNTLGCSITEEKPDVSNLRVLPTGSSAIETRLRSHNLPQGTVHVLSQAIQGLAVSFGLLYPAALGYDRQEAKQLALSAASMLCRGVARGDLDSQSLASFGSRQAFSND